MKFAAMERDASSTKDYVHARYFGSLEGRFLSPDKVGGMVEDPQTWNRYAYARNNPLRFVDPDGNSTALAFAFANQDPRVGAAVEYIPQFIAETTATVAVVAVAVNVPDPTDFVFLAGGRALAGLTARFGFLSRLFGRADEAADAGRGASRGDEVVEGIYEFPDATHAGRIRVGQTKDYSRRTGEHLSDGRLANGSPVSKTGIRGGKTAREVAEQRRINQLGGTREKPGSHTSNIRNPIGKKRKRKIEEDYGPLE